MPKIGTDIIEISRIAKNMENPKFIARIFDEEELLSLGNPLLAESLAARFAAKEAVIKALGEAVPFKDIAVIRQKSGAPLLILKNEALAKANKLNLINWEISLSHSREYAVAMVLATE